METIRFNASEAPTLGVEIELALIDQETMALKSAILDLLPVLPGSLKCSVKPELMQSYVEVNTEVCRDVPQAEEDLRAKLVEVEKAADRIGLRLLWTGTHPFSLWQQQQTTPDGRYDSLIENLQECGRRLVTFGLHVHVGVESGDKAVMICDRILPHLPALLALSANSPWWNNRDTGLMSYRSKVMENLPIAGLPNLMRNWSEYVWLVRSMLDTGFIHSIRDIWWDVRPHHNFGTVEVRICDLPGNLEHTMAIVALIHAMVVTLSKQIDRGTYQRDFHPMMVQQNKWRAARFGLDALLVDTASNKATPARDVVHGLVEAVRPAARELGCESYLGRVLTLAAEPGWAQRQRSALAEAGGSKAAMVRRLSDESRILAAGASAAS